IARCGASKIAISCTPPTPMPVCFLNSAITGCIGTRYGDQIIPLTSAAPAALAAATVRSSIDAAKASGVVPGMRFATVNPTPPSMKLRREIFDLVIFLPPGVFFWMCEMGASVPIPKFAHPDCLVYRRLAPCDPQYGSPAQDNRSRGRGDHDNPKSGERL